MHARAFSDKYFHFEQIWGYSLIFSLFVKTIFNVSITLINEKKLNEP